MRFIRDHRTMRIDVGDVLREVPMNRRRLERACKRYFKRTLAEEIRRVHVDEAKRLLVMTTLPIENVAMRSGFSSATKLSKAFGKLEKLTPSEYRHRFSISRMM